MDADREEFEIRLRNTFVASGALGLSALCRSLHGELQAALTHHAAQPAGVAQNPKFTQDEWIAHCRKHGWRFDLPQEDSSVAAQPAGVEDAASAADWDALQRKYLLRDECLAGINRYLDHAKQQGWQHVPIDIMQALSQVADAARLASKGEAA